MQVSVGRCRGSITADSLTGELAAGRSVREHAAEAFSHGWWWGVTSVGRKIDQARVESATRMRKAAPRIEPTFPEDDDDVKDAPDFTTASMHTVPLAAVHELTALLKVEC